MNGSQVSPDSKKGFAKSEAKIDYKGGENES